MFAFKKHLYCWHF